MKLGKMRTDNIPNNSIIDDTVTVNECITKGDDFAVMNNFFDHLRIQPGQAIEGFADNLEFPLDGGLKLIIGEIILKRFIPRITPDRFGRLANIFKQCKLVKLHRVLPGVG